ncbi:3-hydroxyacyl-CoA dehydrogenase [Bradyrhizobium sp. CCBAU 11430]|uniref:3-hydroxyacyl-CoA dehydrogenase NAD-binding domain-containing protein n=1 Tax=Bradyrhizobium sp. CCBAU 11430 TaxID=1630881 RepID=UPI00230595CB|nr:3-hydroxyacyl-CoA dehydrogenase NAD-binding domain-containing protein [Bradyrhizobium sp. CCBAU 11430]MDA9513046.1 3-hydroxyacyl-CoA dehydrogenase [Bradyrhizobium sp. CCBAU 11430]
MPVKNFRVETDVDGVALVTWNNQGRSVNVLDQTSIDELEEIVEQTTTDTSVKGIVITSGKEAFSDGSEISMLQGMYKQYVRVLKEEGEIPANQMLFDQSRRLSLAFRSIETSGKPWVAAINGRALGSGFELTLCCHHRVAADNPKTQLGFPEIKLGLFPGAGGTQRVPRIVALQQAMQILVKGDTMNVAHAHALRLIDAIVPAPNLVREAKNWIKGGGQALARWDEKGFGLPVGPVYSHAGKMAFRAANAMYRRESYDNYPAKRAILASVYEGVQLPIEAALRVESRYFANVLRSKVTQGMVRTQFLSMAELQAGRRRPQDVPPTKVKKLGLIGAGFMGASVGYVSARAGIEVALIARHQESADKAKAHANSVFNDLIQKGRASESDRDETLSRIIPTTDYAAIMDCDLVIESVFEDRNAKAGVYAKAQPLLKKGAIFASNTSTLPISTLAESFTEQGIFIGIHFFSPVEKMKLVEVILGKKTGNLALATALDYLDQISKIPILVNDSRSFFANRCVRRFVSEGVEMFLEGVPPAMVENCAKMAGMPVGPLSLADEIGLDLRLKVMRLTEADLGQNAIDPAQKQLMVELVENQGRLGRKNRKGFYDYPEKGKGSKTLWRGLTNLQRKHLDSDRIEAEELKQRFLVVQAVEAARTIDERVVTDPRDADVGSILGFGFPPFTGGVLSYIDLMGTTNFISVCEMFEGKYGPRFAPPKLLQQMAEKHETFYKSF